MNRLSKGYGDGISEIEQCYIAGGAILSAITKQETNDYDVYPKTFDGFLNAISVGNDIGYITNVTNNAITFKLNNDKKDNGERRLMQVMYGCYKSPKDIFDNFDYTVCMAAFDCDTKEYTFDDNFWLDVSSRELRFNIGTRYPLNSLLRTKKYMAKGFTISKSQLIKMAMVIQQKTSIHSWDDLENAIGGIYGREIKLLVGENEPFSFDAMMNKLDEVNLEAQLGFVLDNEEDYSNFNELLLSLDDGYRLYKINNKDTMNEHYTVVVVNDINHIVDIVNVKKQSLDLCKNIWQKFGKTIEFKEDNCVVYGYKTLKYNEKENGWNNTVYQAKKVCYKVGEEYEETRSPHIFVAKTKSSLPVFNKSDLKHGKFEVAVNDIVKNDGSNNFIASKVKLIDILDENDKIDDREELNDIFDSLFD